MGVKISGGAKIVSGLKDAVAFAKGDKSKGVEHQVPAEKPLFESTSEREEGVAPPIAPPKAAPEPDVPEIWWNEKEQGAAEDWRPMSEAPKDKPIFVACNSRYDGTKWRYYEIQWFQPPGWNTAGWCIVGARWHMLNDDIPRGWKPSVGHP